MIEHTIVTIKNYPDDGKHQECQTSMPFRIRKGQDAYYWLDVEGNQHWYNMRTGRQKKDWVDDRWIAHMTEDANRSLESIFHVKAHRSLDVILGHCVALYRQSLEMERERMATEIADLDLAMLKVNKVKKK